MIAMTNMDTVVKGVTVSEEKIPENWRGDTSRAMRTMMHSSTMGMVDSTTRWCSKPQ